MKKLFTALQSLVLSVSIQAQSLVIQYDSAGNRVERICDQALSQEGRMVADTSWTFTPLRLDFGTRITDKDSLLRALKVDIPSPRHDTSDDNTSNRAPRLVRSWQLDTTASVGCVPFSDQVLPNGAYTVSIPISPAEGIDFAPSVSLVYNSLAGRSEVGFGWNIAGLSSINLIDRDIYYHGRAEGAMAGFRGQVWALDGVPLVDNDIYQAPEGYSYRIADGYSMVKVDTLQNGTPSLFTVLNPDGSRAEYRAVTSSGGHISYPLRRLVGIRGDYMLFNYVSSGEKNYISSIQYAFDYNDECHACLSFIYSDITDSPTRYRAGLEVADNRLLERIVSCYNDEPVYSYDLIHHQYEGEHLLNEVRCSCGDSHLNPLSFYYNHEDEAVYQGFTSDDFGIIDRTFSANSLVYRAGKLKHGSYADGLAVFPLFDTYNIIGSHKYGSTYSSEQEILVVPELMNDICHTESIFAGAGFQDLQLIDFDGDGTDNVVKIRYSGCSISDHTTSLHVNTYDILDDGSLDTGFSYDITVPGCKQERLVNSPVQCRYDYGDFAGLGRMQLLVTSYTNDCFAYTNNHPGSCLFDLYGGAQLGTTAQFGIGIVNTESMLAIDMDSDGITEILIFNDNGVDVYRYMDGCFSLVRQMVGLTRSVMVQTNRPHYITDINSDGYFDIVISPAVSSESSNLTSWDFYLNTGASFIHHSQDLTFCLTDDRILFKDVNGDGYPDLIRFRGDFIHSFINTHGVLASNYISSGVGCLAGYSKEIIPAGVTYRDRTTHFIGVHAGMIQPYIYREDKKSTLQISRVIDSHGNLTSLSYFDLAQESSPFYTSSPSVTYSRDAFRKMVFPASMVSGCSKWMGPYIQGNPVSDISYKYKDACVSLWGLGFCGFGEVSTEDRVDSLMVTSKYSPQDRGVLTRQTVKCLGSLTDFVSETVNTYTTLSTGYGRTRPRLRTSASSDFLTEKLTQTSYSYGFYDLVGEVESCTTFVDNQSISQCNTTSYTYNCLFQDNRIIIGELSSEQRISSNDLLYDCPQWQEYRTIRYNNRHLPSEVKVYTGANGNKLLQTTRYEYNSAGRVISETCAPYNATVFTGITRSYDQENRFVISQTDDLGRTTTWSDMDIHGNPGTMTDHRGAVTLMTYDDWGNPISKTTPDGAETHTSTHWGGSGLYVTRSSSNAEPATETHFDRLGRTMRSAVQRFDGQWQWVCTEYNRRGLVARESVPCRTASQAQSPSPSMWNSISYDRYGRKTAEHEASGRTSRWEYDGASTTTTVDGISRTSYIDQDLCLQICEDPGGEVRTSVRADGQPSAVDTWSRGVHGGWSSTSYLYDDWGRPTMISNPDAGDRRTSYQNNYDGSESVTQTNANGSITTSTDRYGRTTRVSRTGNGGFSTVYSYSPSGDLVSVESTNGTGTQWTYDQLGRVISQTEYASEDVWLQQTMTYNSAGQISSVGYTSQEGHLTTLQYSYSNGYLVSTSLPDGSIVSTVNAENDLGQTTSVSTYGTQRSYSFSPSGLPVSRIAVMNESGDEIQNETYQFEPSSGNLLGRSDAIHQTADVFSYDMLNRLTAESGNTGAAPLLTSYSNSGNITSAGASGGYSYSDTAHKHRVTGVDTDASMAPRPYGEQSVTYSAYDRPVTICDGDMSLMTATLIYNDAHDRVMMSQTTPAPFTKYYLGGCYEYELRDGYLPQERLYLGGDYYRAPVVLTREYDEMEGEVLVRMYDILRDCQGSVKAIVDNEEFSVTEYSYDAWGRARNPNNGNYIATPEYKFGRGYTGHEHLSWASLINMNARLYDPFLGRFLSADPYVQDPYFSQNWNRYSYCLNNPLKYTDESGEFLGTIFTSLAYLPVAMVKSIAVPYFVGFSDPLKAALILQDAWSEYGRKVANAFKIDVGLFKTDPNLSFTENAAAMLMCFTWESPQTILGNTLSHFRNLFSNINVEYYNGSTLVNDNNAKTGRWGVTLGSYINGNGLSADPATDEVFAHEYGHTKQSKLLGPLYLFVVGGPSFVGALFDYYLHLGNDHDKEWYEVWANQLSCNYSDKYGLKNMINGSKDYYLKQDPDWFFYPTIAYYAGLVLSISIVIL